MDKRNTMEVKMEKEPDKTRAQKEFALWEADFLKVDQKTLFELILAANYMAIDKLLESSCKAVAVKIKSKSPEEIRKFFNIKCDILPDEKSAIRKANAWVDDRCDKS